MLNDLIKVTGNLNIKLIGPDGVVKEDIDHTNLVVSVGKQFIAARMKATGAPAEMSHMELGLGSTAANNADIALDTSFGTVAKVALATAGGTVSTNTITYSATFPAGTGTGAVTEAGIFNSAVGGTMLCRTVFPVVNKPALDVLAINWTITVN